MKPLKELETTLLSSKARWSGLYYRRRPSVIGLLYASIHQLSAKSSFFVCRFLPVQNCNSWSTLLKPAGVITSYQLEPNHSYAPLLRTSYEQSSPHSIPYRYDINTNINFGDAFWGSCECYLHSSDLDRGN